MCENQSKFQFYALAFKERDTFNLGTWQSSSFSGILKEFAGKYLIGKKMVQGGVLCIMYLYIFYVLFVFDDVVNSVVYLLVVKNVFQVGIHGDFKHSAYFVLFFRI